MCVGGGGGSDEKWGRRHSNVKHTVTEKHGENPCKSGITVLHFMNSKCKRVGQWREKKI